MKDNKYSKQYYQSYSNLVGLYYLYAYFSYLQTLPLFHINQTIVRLFDIKFNQGLNTGLSGSAFVDAEVVAGDELSFEIDDIAFDAVVTNVAASTSNIHQAKHPTYITFQSAEKLLADEHSLIKYPNGMINDVLGDVLQDNDIAKDTVEFNNQNNIALNNVLQHNSVSTLEHISSLCNQYGIVFYRDIKDANKLKFCNVFAKPEKATTVKVLDTSTPLSDQSKSTNPVAYIVTNPIKDDNHNIVVHGFDRNQLDSDCTKNIPIKNGIVQSPLVSSVADLTNLYANNLHNHFETYKDVLALDGAGILSVGEMIGFTIEKDLKNKMGDNICDKLLNDGTKNWFVVEASVSISTDGDDFTKVGTCQYSAIVVADSVLNLSSSNLDSYSASTKYLNEGFAVKGYSESDDDASTLDDMAQYQLSIPDYYKQINDDDVINDVAKLHFVHSPDQKHSFPLTHQSPVMLVGLQDPTILGTRNSDTRPSSNKKGSEQNYRLSDNKGGALNFVHTGAFQHDIPNPQADSSVVLESPKYRSDRSAAIRMGDQTDRDIHKGKKAGMALQSQGNFYDIHPNYKATIYGNRNATDAKTQSVAPVHATVSQRLNSDDYPFHWLEGISADDYSHNSTADSSSLSAQVHDEVTSDATATNIINKYTNKITTDIYLDTDHTYTTNDTHDLKYNEVIRNINVDKDGVGITTDTQAKTISHTTTKATNTLEHRTKHSAIDGIASFEEDNVVYDPTEMALGGGELGMVAGTMAMVVPQGISITASGVNVSGANQMIHGMFNVVNDDGNVEDQLKPTTEVLRIYIMDKYCTDEDVSDEKILDDDKKVVKYTQDSVLTPLLTNNYIEAKYFEPSTDIGRHLSVEFKDDKQLKQKYYEIKLTDDTTDIAMSLGSLAISNNKFQSLIVGINGKKIEDIKKDDFKHHQNTLSLTQDDWIAPTDWDLIPPTQETINDVDTTINHLVINVFEPPMMINLREDYYFAYYKAKASTILTKQILAKVTGNILQQVTPDYISKCDRLKPQQKQELQYAIDKYNALQQRYRGIIDYFDLEGHDHADIAVDEKDDFWEEYLTNFAKKNNKNITLVIHGYNVPTKDGKVGYPRAMEYADSQYYLSSNELMKDAFSERYTSRNHSAFSPFTKYKYISYSDEKASILPMDELSVSFNNLGGSKSNDATGACAWNLQFEANLNFAAGYTNGLIDYSRTVQIAWQGNPASPAPDIFIISLLLQPSSTINFAYSCFCEAVNVFRVLFIVFP